MRAAIRCCGTSRARALRHAWGRGDSGMAVSGLMLTVALAALVLLMLVVVPLMQHTANSDQAEDAADAAALAAVQRIRTLSLDAVTGLAAGGSLTAGMPVSAGIDAAATYASRNDADLVPGTYAIDWGRGRVDLRVALRDRGEVDAADPDRTLRNGAAELGVALGTCRLDRRDEIIGYEPVPTPTPEPTPTATPTPSPTPTPTPTPVPIWGSSYRFVCDGYSGDWDRDRGDVLEDARAWLDARLVPRLVR